MKDLGLSKNLLSAVSGIIKTSTKQRQEQSQQQAPSYNQHYGKLGAARPLSMEEAKAATEEAHAPARRVAATIRGMYVKEDVTEAKKDINDPHEKETLKKRKERGQGEAVDEGKAHTIPKTAKEKSLAALAHPKDKITHKDVMVGRGVVKETQQVDEISTELATSYLNKRDAQAKPDMNTPETNVRASKVAKGIRGAISRMHGYGRDKNAENKVTGRFQYRQNVGATHVFNKEETEHVEEGWDEMMKAAKERNKPQPNGGAGVKKGTRYGGANQKDEKPVKEEVAQVEENKDTPGNGYEHQCAIHVKHSKLGEGRTLFSQHAEPAEDGTIEWYDVMFEHGIEKKVPTADLEILVTESHMNHKKKK